MSYHWLIPHAYRILPSINKKRHGKYQHITFLVKGRKILNYGWNDSGKTHPVCCQYGHPTLCMHSEVNCVLRATPEQLKRGTLVNIQIRRGRVVMSRPCEPCQNFLYDQGVDKIWYTNYDGKFECFDFAIDYDKVSVV